MDYLHTFALLTQMFVISVYLPARVVGAVEVEPPGRSEPQVDGYRFQR